MAAHVVAAVADIPPGTRKLIEAGGRAIVVFNLDGEFFALAKKFPAARFRWIDIEDQADEVGDLEVENFPTIRVTRDNELLFHGTQLPIHAHLERLLEELFARQGK